MQSAACDVQSGIGHEGKLPWGISGELAFWGCLELNFLAFNFLFFQSFSYKLSRLISIDYINLA